MKTFEVTETSSETFYTKDKEYGRDIVDYNRPKKDSFQTLTGAEDDYETKNNNFQILEEMKRFEKIIDSFQNGTHHHKSFPKQTYPEVAFKSYKDRKRILVTGGAGFIGSHLVDELMLQGHEVVVADNFATGHKSNIERWVGHENFELLNHDVINPLYIEVEQIYHLASPSAQHTPPSNPIKAIKTNTIGTINLLGLAKRVRARLLFTSSAEIYGEPKDSRPMAEEYWGHVDQVSAGGCYGEAKRVAETMCYAYQKQEGVDVRVARLFPAIGPRMELEHGGGGHVVSILRQALLHQPVVLPASTNQSVSFLYVSDVIKGLISLMNSNHSTPLNIGSPLQHSLPSIARIALRIAGSNSSIVYRDGGFDGDDDDDEIIIKRVPDVRAARRVLGWQQEVGVEEALRSTMQYFMTSLERRRGAEGGVLAAGGAEGGVRGNVFGEGGNGG